ncbi:prolyl oligopeptidase [Hypoxylon crocopeplum]|nr:prolyl oligopeptidase [Hypoxylon crocopeplum]
MGVDKLTPELLTSASTRTSAVPNHDGTLALYTMWGDQLDDNDDDDDDDDGYVQIRVMNIATGNSICIVKCNDAFAPTWLGDGSNTVLFMTSKRGGTILLSAIEIAKSQSAPYLTTRGLPTAVAHFPMPVKGLKVKALRDGSIAFVVFGPSGTDSGLCNDRKGVNSAHTGRVYDRYQVQEWNTYMKPHKHTIFYSTLSKTFYSASSENEQEWKVTAPLRDALINTNLEPIQGFGYSSMHHYDISQGGITFTAHDLDVENPSLLENCNVYYVQLDSFATASASRPVRIDAQAEGPDGCSLTPRFSPDASQIAFLHDSAPGTERQICLHHIGSHKVDSAFDTMVGRKWSLDPEHFEFAPNGRSLYISANDTGRIGLYKLDLKPNAEPRRLIRGGTVSAFHPFGQDDDELLLVTSSSLLDSSLWRIIDANGDNDPMVVSSATGHGSEVGLSRSQISEIYFQNEDHDRIHAWMIKPRHFDKSRKYPLALLVHGGPIGAWRDEWRTTSFPPLWAEQGYIVVAPNITGSTGFGLEFQSAIQDNWGGKPYNDLVKCMEHLERDPNIDIDNAVIAGASYGGYMVNWIQGHTLGRRFKAMVCDSGIFHLPTHSLQSDVPLSREDFTSNEIMEQQNPARPDLLPNWKTPMLVIHNNRDYRCPFTEGLAAFHHLQSLGTPSRLLTFSDEGHSLGDPGNGLEYHRQVFAWVNKYTGIAEQPEKE